MYGGVVDCRVVYVRVVLSCMIVALWGHSLSRELLCVAHCHVVSCGRIVDVALSHRCCCVFASWLLRRHPVVTALLPSSKQSKE